MRLAAVMLVVSLPVKGGAEERWFDVLFRGQKVGYAVEQWGPVDGDGFSTLERYSRRMFRRGSALVTDGSTLSAVVKREGGEVDVFRFESWSDAGDRYRVDVDWVAGELTVKRGSGGDGAIAERVPLATPPVLASLATANGAAAATVVDDETGRISRGAPRDRSSVVTYVPVPRDRAQAPFDPIDVTAAAAVPADRVLPAPGLLTRVRLAVSGPLADFAFEAGARVISRGWLRSRARASGARGRQAIIETEAPSSSLSRPGRVLARVLDLARAVYRGIRLKGPAPLYSSVDTVLATRQGDCKEHALLLGNILAAEGIPSRMVIGLVYAERAFRLHQWVEARLDGVWTPLDPTLENGSAGATHLKLGTFATNSMIPTEVLDDLIARIPGSRIKIDAVDVGDGWRHLGNRK